MVLEYSERAGEGMQNRGWRMDVVVWCVEPTCDLLLLHRFIKTAKKSSFLTELIERKQRWQQVLGNNTAEHDDDDDDDDKR